MTVKPHSKSEMKRLNALAGREMNQPQGSQFDENAAYTAAVSKLKEIAPGRSLLEDRALGFTQGFVAGARWQASQSREPIVDSNEATINHDVSVLIEALEEITRLKYGSSANEIAREALEKWRRE